MSEKRVPNMEDLNKLTRDEWETLCGNLCSIKFQVNRIEDRRGKGNGLDAWRRLPGGNIEGFQFRKFDSRLAYAQAVHIKDNIKLAYERASKEFGGSIIKFTILINIDLEPGHCNKKGELEYFNEIREWANERYSLEVNYFGVSWVLTQLLCNPYLMPALFENLSGEIKDIKDLLREGFETVNSKSDIVYDALKAIQSESRLGEKNGDVIYKLTTEALVHYERGQEYQQTDKVSSAIRSMEDAKRLLEINNNANTNLLGKVLCALCGLKTLAGYLDEAHKDGQRAIDLIRSTDDQILILHAFGNVAYSLYQSREQNKCKEAKKTFVYLLDIYEKNKSLDDILLSLIHITETCIYLGDFKEVFYWSDRISNFLDVSKKTFGNQNILCLNARGTLGNALFQSGMSTNNKIQIKESYRIFDEVEQLARINNQKLVAVAALSQKAICLWNLDDLVGADQLLGYSIEESKEEFRKNAADALYNRALLNKERGDTISAETYFKESRIIYIKLNDLESVRDVNVRIERLRSLVDER